MKNYNQFQYSNEKFGWLYIHAYELHEARRIKEEINFLSLQFDNQWTEIINSCLNKSEIPKSVMLFKNNCVALAIYSNNQFDAEKIKVNLNSDDFTFYKMIDYHYIFNGLDNK